MTLIKYLLIIGLLLAVCVLGVDYHYRSDISGRLDKAARAELRGDTATRDTVLRDMKVSYGRNAVDFLVAIVDDKKGDTLRRHMAQLALDHFRGDYQRSRLLDGPTRNLLRAMEATVDLDGSTLDYAKAVDYLRSADPGIRAVAARRLGELGTKEAARHLDGVLADPYWLVRFEAVRALAAVAPGETAPRLLELAEDPVAAVRDEAIRQAGRTGTGDQVFRKLQALLEQEFVPAAEALGALGDGRARPDLVKALDASIPANRFAAARALMTLGAPEGRKFLLDAVRGAAEADRAAAAEALAADTSPEGIDALVTASADRSPEVRRAAATSLGRRGGPKAAASLKVALADPDETVVAAALRAIGELRDTRLLGLVPEYLGRGGWQVQTAAIEALAAADERSMVKHLEDLLQTSEDARVQQAAWRALKRLTGREYDAVGS